MLVKCRQGLETGKRLCGIWRSGEGVAQVQADGIEIPSDLLCQRRLAP